VGKFSIIDGKRICQQCREGIENPDFCCWYNVHFADFSNYYYYNTTCKKSIEFDTGERVSQGFLFCPFCGRLIVEKEEG
jgi:hypothetical protein